jgi:hypothetical protein
MIPNNHKRQIKITRAIAGIAILIVGTYIVLTLVGRSVGDRPLPWRHAWLGAFGEKGWHLGFDMSVKKTSSKSEVVETWGEPVSVTFRYQEFSPDEIDLLESRSIEVWDYASPFNAAARPTIVFMYNKVIGH